jgi:hypothetical protein
VNEEQFIALLDETGREPTAWPAHLRDDARAVLAGSAKARAALAAMREMERLLALSVPAAALDTPLDIGAIAANATRQPQGRRHSLGSVVRKVSFAALGVMALAAGILVGMTPPSGTSIVGSVKMALNAGGNDVW